MTHKKKKEKAKRYFSTCNVHISVHIFLYYTKQNIYIHLVKNVYGFKIYPITR